MGILVLGMVLLLVLNTSLASGAFEISALSAQQRDLAVREQRLVQDVARAEAPESLQDKARALGMVPVAAPVFLRLSDGQVLGIPRPAKAAPVTALPATGSTGPAPSASPAPTPSASASASASRRPMPPRPPSPRRRQPRSPPPTQPWPTRSP